MSLPVIERMAAPTRVHEVAVAVPACNESERIEACVAALDRSARRARPSRVAVTLFVNNSGDATAAIARAMRPKHLRLTVVETELAPDEAHAGGARRAALDLALNGLAEDGVLMTTDADSCVHRDWISANLAEVEAGADVVAGAVTFLPDARVAVPPARNAEWRLAQVHARLHSLLDPRPQARWPTHIWAWGASLAVTARAYRAVGGLPSLPLAEDRALVDLLEVHGFGVRRSHAPVVYTSPRRRGRAPGGFADLLASYVDDDGGPCDAALEPTANLVRRLAWRAHLRGRHAAHGPLTCTRMVRRLGVPSAQLASAEASFGQWWQRIEAIAPVLRRERVTLETLSSEIGRATRLVNLIERLQAGRAETARSARAAAH
jgi:Glycosyl transferase family 2